MLFKTPSSPNFVRSLLFFACCLAPRALTSRADESVASVLKRVYDEDFAVRVNGQQAAGAGTTLDIKEIVIGRCWDYQRVKMGKLPSEIECESVAWRAFANAFAYQDPCSTPNNAFRNFINVMAVSLPVDGTIFWSGTKNLAQRYSRLSGGTAFSLETTFLGYTVDGLKWCGSPTGGVDGIDYGSCPSFDDPGCRSHVSSVFWREASLSFARQARGSVSVLLNGSNPNGGAFRNDSFFADIELPNLDTSKVNLVNILVVHNLHGEIIDTCDDGTILILKDRIIKRGLKWTCKDDPKLAKLIQCSEKPDNEKCNLASGVHTVHKRSFYIIVTAVILAALLIIGMG